MAFGGIHSESTGQEDIRLAYEININLQVHINTHTCTYTALYLPQTCYIPTRYNHNKCADGMLSTHCLFQVEYCFFFPKNPYCWHFICMKSQFSQAHQVSGNHALKHGCRRLFNVISLPPVTSISGSCVQCYCLIVLTTRHTHLCKANVKFCSFCASAAITSAGYSFELSLDLVARQRKELSLEDYFKSW